MLPKINWKSFVKIIIIYKHAFFIYARAPIRYYHVKKSTKAVAKFRTVLYKQKLPTLIILKTQGWDDVMFQDKGAH